MNPRPLDHEPNLAGNCDTPKSVLGLAGGAAAQGNPTGATRSQVVDPDNLPVPGVMVTARSLAVQGSRTTLTWTDFSLSVVNNTSVLREHVFFEGQFSRKRHAMTGSGSRFSDLVKGTPITDRSRTTMFNSPGRCNVCEDGWLEQRDNSDWFVKLGYFCPSAASCMLRTSRARPTG